MELRARLFDSFGVPQRSSHGFFAEYINVVFQAFENRLNMQRIGRCYVDRVYLICQQLVQRTESIGFRSRFLGKRLSFIQIQVDYGGDFCPFIILQISDMYLCNKARP